MGSPGLVSHNLITIKEETLENYIFYQRKEGQNSWHIQNPWKGTKKIRMEWKGTKNINISHFVSLLGDVGHTEMSLELFNTGWKRVKTEKANWIGHFFHSLILTAPLTSSMCTSLDMAERWSWHHLIFHESPYTFEHLLTQPQSLSEVFTLWEHWHHISFRVLGILNSEQTKTLDVSSGID